MMPVKELLESSLTAVALKLRASLLEHVPNTVVERAMWLRQEHSSGRKTRLAFDANALTFVLSSWNFEWESAVFSGAKPVAFDHGAHMPIVVVTVPRAGGDGCNVYCSGTDDAVERVLNGLRFIEK